MKYASKPVPEGAKFRNAPLLAAGIGILRVCHLLRITEKFINSQCQMSPVGKKSTLNEREDYICRYYVSGNIAMMTQLKKNAPLRANDHRWR